MRICWWIINQSDTGSPTSDWNLTLYWEHSFTFHIRKKSFNRSNMISFSGVPFTKNMLVFCHHYHWWRCNITEVISILGLFILYISFTSWMYFSIINSLLVWCCLGSGLYYITEWNCMIFSLHSNLVLTLLIRYVTEENTHLRKHRKWKMWSPKPWSYDI